MPNTGELGPASLDTMVISICRDSDKVWDEDQNIAGYVTARLDGSVLTLDYEPFEDTDEPVHESTSVSFVELNSLREILTEELGATVAGRVMTTIMVEEV